MNRLMFTVTPDNVALTKLDDVTKLSTKIDIPVGTFLDLLQEITEVRKNNTVLKESVRGTLSIE